MIYKLSHAGNRTITPLLNWKHTNFCTAQKWLYFEHYNTIYYIISTVYTAAVWLDLSYCIIVRSSIRFLLMLYREIFQFDFLARDHNIYRVQIGRIDWSQCYCIKRFTIISWMFSCICFSNAVIGFKRLRSSVEDWRWPNLDSGFFYPNIPYKIATHTKWYNLTETPINNTTRKVASEQKKFLKFPF